MISALIIIIIILFLPPVGVIMLAGCGADFLINIALTILGVLPGTIHAYYIAYIYYTRKEKAQRGELIEGDAPGVYSQKVLSGGVSERQQAKAREEVMGHQQQIPPHHGSQQGHPQPQEGAWAQPPPQQGYGQEYPQGQGKY